MIFTFFLYNLVLLVSTYLLFVKEKLECDRFCSFFLGFLAFLVVLLPAVFRYNIGTDYLGYAEIYQEVANGERAHGEIGFWFLCKIFTMAGIRFEYFVAFISSVTYGVVFLSYPKKNMWLYNFIFIATVYLYTYSNLRTGLVVAIVIAATIRYMKDRKLLNYILFVLFASLFHKVSVFYFIFPFFILNSFVQMFRFVFFRIGLLLILLFVFIYRFEIYQFVISLNVASLFNYQNYVSSKLFGTNVEFNSGFGFILKIFPAVYVFILTREKQLLEFVSISVLLMIFLIFSVSVDFLARLDILSSVYFVSLAGVAEGIGNKRLWKWGIGGLMLILLVLYNQNIRISRSDKCDGIRVSPYVSIFNKYKDESLKVTRVDCFHIENKI